MNCTKTLSSLCCSFPWYSSKELLICKLFILLLFSITGLTTAYAATGNDKITAADALPFERTEVRATCDNYDPLKQPFFGELHLHTAYSFDAGGIDTRNTPENVYDYARATRANRTACSAFQLSNRVQAIE